MPLADLIALDVVAVGGSFPVEVGPGSASAALADRGGATRLEAVGAVVDALGSARERSRENFGFEEDGREGGKEASSYQRTVRT